MQQTGIMMQAYTLRGEEVKAISAENKDNFIKTVRSIKECRIQWTDDRITLLAETKELLEMLKGLLKRITCSCKHEVVEISKDKWRSNLYITHDERFRRNGIEWSMEIDKDNGWINAEIHNASGKVEKKYYIADVEKFIKNKAYKNKLPVVDDRWLMLAVKRLLWSEAVARKFKFNN